MIAAPVSDLPAPDSPTTPSTSPGAMAKHTSCTATSVPRRVRELHAEILDRQQWRGAHRDVVRPGAYFFSGTRQPEINSTSSITGVHAEGIRRPSNWAFT